MTVLEQAQAYLRAGLGVLPIRLDGSKAPALPKGHPYLKQAPTAADLKLWFRREKPYGIGIPNGKVSGNKECIDFETEAIYRQWAELVDGMRMGLTFGLCHIKTPGHIDGQRGMHVHYQVEPGFTVPGSQKLASVRGGDAVGGETTCLIETRGEGGYTVAPGSPMACHETGRSWEQVSGSDLCNLPIISAECRGFLIDMARALNQVAAEAAQPGGDLRPGADYNARGPDWPDILTGWEMVRQAGEVRYWRRPGKARDWSATTGHCHGEDGTDLLYVFSGNAHPFEPMHAYSKFRAYAAINHQSNLSAAAKDLASKGYGEPARPRSKPPTARPTSEAMSAKERHASEVIAELSRPDAAMVWQLDGLLAAQLPPLRWVIDGLVPDEGLTFLGGRKKLGKSWLCLQFALAVAAGVPVLGRSVVQGPVVYVVLEDGERRVRDRFIKQGAIGGLPITIYTRFPPLDQLDGMGELIHVLEQGPRLVMIDTLAAAKTGKTDENAAGPMADISNQLRRLGQHFKAAMMVTHHHGKSIGEDPGDDLRGSSALGGAGDVNLGLYADGEQRGRLKGEGRDITPFDLALEFDPVLTWAWQLLGDKRVIAKQEADDAVLEALRTMSEASSTQIAEMLGRDRKTVAERLYRLASEGRVIPREIGTVAGKPYTLFRLPLDDENSVGGVPK